MGQTTCTPNTVDERAVRLVAGIVIVIALVSLWPPAMWAMGLLAADFAIRAWVGRAYSPLRWIAKRTASALGLSVKPVYAPPKQFAARIGSAITAVAALLHVAGAHEAALAVTAVLIIAASLEALAGFCLACWLYPYVHRSRQA